MARRRFRNQGLRRGDSPSIKSSSHRKLRPRGQFGERLRFEQLEDRLALSVDPYAIYFTPPANVPNSQPPVFAAPGGIAEQVLPPIAPFALDQTFQLNSDPTAPQTIYLDFTGHLTTNNFWNLVSGVPTFVTRPFTKDGDAFQFNDDELLTIQYIWSRVAEDLAPFHINVTTEDPGDAAMLQSGFQRVVIGGNGDWAGGPPAIGVADATFPVGDDIAVYLFAENIDFNMDTIFAEEEDVANLVTYALGITFSLGGDNVITPLGIFPYGGHGTGSTAWAPIMGDFQSLNPLKQWSKGEYHFATNTQDDLAIITNPLINGVVYKEDDHGNVRQNATQLTPIGNQVFGSGLIERNFDIDMFRFEVTGEYGEAINFEIDPFHRGPNLDILAKIYNQSGVVIAESNPVDELNAPFNINLSPGIYYLSVEGTGRPHLSPTDYGYSDYGSLGHYTIIGSRLELLVGVDFDLPTSPNSPHLLPLNWTRYTGIPVTAVLSDLKNEGGITTPANLRISTNGVLSTREESTAKVETLPTHFTALDNISGNLSAPNWTFTWSDLDPFRAYEVYVFGLGTQDNQVQHVEVNGVETVNFTQTLTANNLFINETEGFETFALQEFAVLVTSTGAGIIEIAVTPETGMASIGGLGIRPAQAGSIEGQKWNDLNGDGIKDPGEPGLPDWTIFLDENDNGILDSELGITVDSIDIPQAISDLAIVKSDLQFSGLGSIVDVDVMLDITHTYNGDLNVFLISPSGTRVELFSDVGSFTDNFHGTILDDDAPISITAGTAPYTGSFRPEQPLSTFNGENPNGVWTLEIKDDANTDVGVLNAWSITIVGAERSTITDANGNYKFEKVLPGTYHVREVLEVTSPFVPTFAPPPVTVSSAALVQDIDFGNWIPTVIETSTQGVKWNDLNGDGFRDGDEPGLEGWEIYVDGNNNGMLDLEAEVTLESEDIPMDIRDFRTTISRIDVEGLSAVIDVDVTLDITHSYAGDLEVYLISPTGRQVELFTNVGGQLNDFTGTTLDDDADTSIVESAAPFSGTFRPEGLLSDFNGEDPTGTWQLLIRDTGLGDQGILNSWSMKIIGRERSTITDANGEFDFPNLEPGIYIIREVMQPGWVQTAPILSQGIDYWEVVLDEETGFSGVDFGNQFVGLTTLSGDYNEDGVVNAADYVMWRDHLGSVPGGGSGSGSDGNHNNTVDQGDYDMWVENFGNTSGGGTGAAAMASAGSSGSAESALLSSFDGGGEPGSASNSFAMRSGGGAGAAASAVASNSRFGGTGFRAFATGSGQYALNRPESDTAPSGDRIDMALVAWLAGLGDRVSNRVENHFDGLERWHSNDEMELEGEANAFVVAVDEVFEEIGV